MIEQRTVSFAKLLPKRKENLIRDFVSNKMYQEGYAWYDHHGQVEPNYYLMIVNNKVLIYLK